MGFVLGGGGGEVVGGEQADRDAIKAGDNNHWPPLSTVVNLSILTITKCTFWKITTPVGRCSPTSNTNHIGAKYM